MKACLQLQQLFCSREYQLASRFNQQNEKSTSNVRVVMGQQQMKAVTHDNLQRQVQEYCQKNKTRRKQEWKSLRTALEELRRHKEQQIWQQSQEKWDASYA